VIIHEQIIIDSIDDSTSKMDVSSNFALSNIVSTTIEDKYLNYVARLKKRLFEASGNPSSYGIIFAAYDEFKFKFKFNDVDLRAPKSLECLEISVKNVIDRQLILSYKDTGKRNLFEIDEFERLTVTINIETGAEDKKVEYDDKISENVSIGVDAVREEAEVSGRSISFSKLSSLERILKLLLLMLLFVLSLVAKFKLGPDAWSVSDVTYTVVGRQTEDALHRPTTLRRDSGSSEDETEFDDPGCIRNDAADKTSAEGSVELNNANNDSIESRRSSIASDDEACVASSLQEPCSVFRPTENEENIVQANDVAEDTTQATTEVSL